MKNSENKWALITGAQGGIGKALVNTFISKGYNVIAADIIEPTKSENERVFNFKLDLAQLALSEEYSELVYKNVMSITSDKGITALVNNAAVQVLANSKTLTRKQWQDTFNVNLTAPFFLSQLFIKELCANAGAVVNISSIHATQTKDRFVAYATSKAALSAMSRNMVLDLGKHIRINAIEPAAIETDMLKAGFIGNIEGYRRLEQFHPIGRVGQPEEVALLAAYLCSNEAKFVQGACISASGGIQGSLSDPG